MENKDILGKFFESEAAITDKYYRVIQTIKEYSDGRRFPLNEIVVAKQKVNLKWLVILLELLQCIRLLTKFSFIS